MKSKLIVISSIIIILLLCIVIGIVIFNNVNKTSSPNSFEHIKLLEIDSMNWSAQSMSSDYFLGTHYEVYRDGYVYTYDSYNISGKKDEKKFNISTKDVTKIEKNLKENINKPADNSASDGTGWTFKYFDLEGNIIGKYAGYIYQYNGFNEILELLEK